MLFDYDATKEIYLIFMDDCNYRGSFLFKQGFKHCFAVERQALGWVCIDPSRTDFASYVLPAAFGDDIITPMAKQNPSYTILQLFVYPLRNKPMNYPGLGLISCVSVMQYSLGVYWPLIVTPYQLYCRLSKGLIEHIKVGKVWAAEVQSEQQTRRQKHQEQRLKTSESKQHS